MNSNTTLRAVAQPASDAALARPVWGTQKHRAEDLIPGDVVRNKYGKWDVVIQVSVGAQYVDVTTELGGTQLVRTVHLLDVQVVKPS